jgi:NADPH2:quinone reductase
VRAVQITEFGGPEVLRVVDIPGPSVDDGLVLIDVHAAGVNYADTHQIEDSYLVPQSLPLVPGAEVVGIVRGGALDGRRVVALTLTGGGYAEQAIASPRTVFPIPDVL